MRVTDSWYSDMLTAMPIRPSRANEPSALPSSFRPRFFSSRTANGMSTRPPTTNRLKLSWMGLNCPEISFSATSMLENSSVVTAMYR